MNRHGGENEKGLGITRALRERLKPVKVEAGSVEDFARLIAQNPNPSSPIWEHIMQQQGLPVQPGTPFIHLSVQPTGSFGEGFEFVYQHEEGKPQQIVYREANPHPMDPQEMLAIMQRQHATREQLRATMEAAGEQLEQAGNRQGLDGLLTLFGEMGEYVRRGQTRGNSLWGLTALVPASPEGTAYREAMSRYEQSFDEDRIEGNMAAYTTAQVRGIRLEQQIRELIPGNQANILIDFNFGSPKLIARVQEERGGKPAWETPAPRKTRSIRRGK